MCNLNELSRGTVVWVYAPDEKGGNPKVRPMVIISSNRAIRDYPDKLVAVCATSTPNDQKADKFVYLGGGFQSTNYAGLPRASWVNTQWYHTFKLEDIQDVGGRVEKSVRAKILNKAASLYDKHRPDR